MHIYVDEECDDRDWLDLEDCNQCVALVPYIAPPKPKSPLFFFPHPSPSHPEYTSQNPQLINDIMPVILQYCDATTLSRFSSTCHTFNRMANNDDLWNRLCQTKFGVVADELRPKPDPVRVLYVLQVRRMMDVYRGMHADKVRVQRVRSDVVRSIFMSNL